MATTEFTHAHQFDDAEQQFDAATLGMWVFLLTEIMFFGGLFCGYTVYRSQYLPSFEAGSRLLDIRFGATNTAVLLASSLTMALAVHAAQTRKRNALMTFVILTMLLGIAFLGIKFFYEWIPDWKDGVVPGLHWAPVVEVVERVAGRSGAVLPRVEMFFVFYFFMTGMHALHMVVGLGIMTYLLLKGRTGAFTSGHFTPVETSGLYWHFVDIVWIFLFPLLYLIGGRY
jgi:cytochrome c oxidase subunit III